MSLTRSLSAAFVALSLSAQRLAAGDLLPDAFLGWFVPAAQTCAADVPITVRADRIVTTGGVQRVTQVRRSDRSSRRVWVSLETVGGAGTEEILIELAPDGLDLRVLFGDGNWLTWRRCL